MVSSKGSGDMPMKSSKEQIFSLFTRYFCRIHDYVVFVSSPLSIYVQRKEVMVSIIPLQLLGNTICKCYIRLIRIATEERGVLVWTRHIAPCWGGTGTDMQCIKTFSSNIPIYHTLDNTIRNTILFIQYFAQSSRNAYWRLQYTRPWGSNTYCLVNIIRGCCCNMYW